MIILGSGPNRIGQGIEFDYSCVHASLALAEAGYETIMVNCNPETVSTDYDTSDRLYFEPLTLEDVLEIVHAEQQAGPVAGVVCQLGGQTPLGLAQGLADAGVPIVGTTPEAIHLAEERGAFGRVLADAGLPAPKHGTATSYPQAQRIAHEIGYPVLVRPSYVLGGRGMEIVYDDAALEAYLEKYVANGLINERQPVLVDRFLDDAVEIDVDAHLRRRGALPRRRDGAHRGGRHPLRRLLVRAAADHARPRGDRPDPPLHRGDRPRARRARACSTSSSPSPPTCSTSSRPTRARRGPCRSCPRPPRRRWPRPRPG